MTVGLAACGAALDSASWSKAGGGAQSEPGPGGGPLFVEDWVQIAPRADCGAGSLPDTGLQGQVPLADRESGRNTLGYRCNLELVGQYQGQGASWMQAWYEDCVYYDQAFSADLDNPGTVVIDNRDPAKPTPSTWLDSIGALDPWEGLKVSQKRALLAMVNAHNGFGGPEIDLYDVKEDCRHPKLLFSGAPTGMPAALQHGANLSADGTIFYTTQFFPPVFAIDVADPTAPSLLTTLPYMSHDHSTSEDGSRLYLAHPAVGDNTGSSGAPGRDGLEILDVSLVHQHIPGAVARPIAALYWNDGGTAQSTQPVTIAGHPYLIFVDEFGPGGSSPGNNATACDAGVSPYGFARIIDLADETRPTVVSKIMLEVHDPANCKETVADHPGDAFAYDNHYCQVDDPANATALACSELESGLRVYDIRDPVHPREIAYYNPPARPDQADKILGAQNLPGSSYTDGNLSADWTSANPYWRVDRNEIWFTSHDNGFQVVKFTNGAYPLDKK
jgi:hypothetical protein